MDPEQESKVVNNTLNEWKKMSTHPNAVAPLYMGHTPRYWTTFKVSPPAGALKKSKAQVYIMNGTDDPSSPVTSSDLLAAELTVANRKFVYDRIPYANHGFVAKGKNGFSEVWAKAFKWAVESQ